MKKLSILFAVALTMFCACGNKKEKTVEAQVPRQEIRPARGFRTDIPLDSIRLSDPCILADKATGMYYMTGTRGLLWKSRDLARWEGPYHVAMTDTNSWMGRRPEIWAAELHQYGGKYYYFATFTNNAVKIDTVAGNIIPRRASHVLVSDKPEGPYLPMADATYLPDDMPTLDGTFWVDTDGSITLTETGLAIAEKIYERHTMMTDLLIRMGVSRETAAADACKLEHAISDESFEAIKRHMADSYAQYTRGCLADGLFRAEEDYSSIFDAMEDVLRDVRGTRPIYLLGSNGGYGTLEEWEADGAKREWMDWLNRLPVHEEYVRPDGKKVMLIAGDTFRAGAIEQLNEFIEKDNPMIRSLYYSSALTSLNGQLEYSFSVLIVYS